MTVASPATCLQSHNQPGSGPGPAPATALLQSPSSLASLLWPCLLNACLKLFTNRRFWKNGLKLLWVKRLLGGYEHLWWRGEAGFEMYMPVYNCMKNRFLLVEVYVLSIITRNPQSPADWPVCVLTCPMCPGLGHVSPGTVLSTQHRAGKYLIKTSADQELFRLLHRHWWTSGYIYPLLRGLRGDAPMLPCHLPPATWDL